MFVYIFVNVWKIVIVKIIGEDIVEDLYKINDELGMCRKCFFKIFKNMLNYRLYIWLDFYFIFVK